MTKCPRCATGILADDSFFGVKGVKCFNCGAWHEVGSNRESIDYQVHGTRPTRSDNTPSREVGHGKNI